MNSHSLGRPHPHIARAFAGRAADGLNKRAEQDKEQMLDEDENKAMVAAELERFCKQMDGLEHPQGIAFRIPYFRTKEG